MTAIRIREAYIEAMRAAALLLIALTVACSPADIAVVSPDGNHTARVREEWWADPPKQSLWLDDVLIANLEQDAGGCRTIVWSGDGSTVGYLVQDAKLIVVDAATHRITSTQRLVATSHSVCGLALSEDGSTATFKSCPFDRQACSEPQLASLR